MWTRKADYLVIGSGLAGLIYALKVAPFGKVIVAAKSDLSDANTVMAQGGVAAVMSPKDSFENHVRDTLSAGAGLCREDVVRMVVEQAPDRIQELIAWGVQFDIRPDGSELSLTREGGHSHRRILHIEDHTGRDLHRQLLVVAKNHPNIEFLDQVLALDLITNRTLDPLATGPARVHGSYFLSRKDQEVGAIVSPFVVLATGGAGKVYLYTSNWSGATGDGIAMAFRAGARVANLELMQFHPTCLYHPQARNFLITEAMRGEGAELVNSQGETFMLRYHHLGSLAPRDIVARSIDAEMKRTGSECVFLRNEKMSPDQLRRRFPVIYEQCLHFGIDITEQPIPVVPAAHYLCGGILTDSLGQTDVENLFAIGETACTGLHGANRLASNSLLECLVFGHNSAMKTLEMSKKQPIDTAPDWPFFENEDADELIVIPHMWEEIRRLMWNYVGIVRSDRRLIRAQHRLKNIRQEIFEFYSHFRTTPDLVELRNIALVAELTVRCAMKRGASCGIHYNLDQPEKMDVKPADSILSFSDLDRS